METATWVQILDEPDCITHRTNSVGEWMNPVLLSLTMSK